MPRNFRTAASAVSGLVELPFLRGRTTGMILLRRYTLFVGPEESCASSVPGSIAPHKSLVGALSQWTFARSFVVPQQQFEQHLVRVASIRRYSPRQLPASLESPAGSYRTMYYYLTLRSVSLILFDTKAGAIAIHSSDLSLIPTNSALMAALIALLTPNGIARRLLLGDAAIRMCCLYCF